LLSIVVFMCGGIDVLVGTCFHGDYRTLIMAPSVPNVMLYHIRLRGVVWEAYMSLYPSSYGIGSRDRSAGGSQKVVWLD